MKSDYDRYCKLVLFGDKTVGKSYMLKTLINEPREKVYRPTIGIDIGFKTVNINDFIIKFQIVDTGDQNPSEFFIDDCYRHSGDAYTIMYDITNKSSFEYVKNFFEKYYLYNKDILKKSILIGNKLDLESERQVSYEEGKKLAHDNNILFFEISVEDGKNIDVMIESICRKLVKEKEDNKEPIVLTKSNNKKNVCTLL